MPYKDIVLILSRVLRSLPQPALGGATVVDQYEYLELRQEIAAALAEARSYVDDEGR